MTIVLDAYPLPEAGTVELNINRTFEIKISAQEAQRRVGQWVCDEVSMLMGAEEPTLVVGKAVVWRVPIFLTAPQVGRVGQVGTVEVEVSTGTMHNTPACQADIIQRARKLAQHLPPYQPQDVPDEYLAKDVPLSSRLNVTEEDSIQAE